MNLYDKYVVPLWKEYKLLGIAIGIALILAVLTVAQLVLGVDIGGTVNRWLEAL